MNQVGEFGWAQKALFGSWLKDVLKSSAHAFGMSVDQLTGPSRSKQVALARQVAIFVARELTGASYPELGHAFRRDHTTVMWAERKIRRQLATDPSLRRLVAELRMAIRPPDDGTVCTAGRPLARCSTRGRKEETAA